MEKILIYVIFSTKSITTSGIQPIVFQIAQHFKCRFFTYEINVRIINNPDIKIWDDCKSAN